MNSGLFSRTVGMEDIEQLTKSIPVNREIYIFIKFKFWSTTCQMFQFFTLDVVEWQSSCNNLFCLSIIFETNCREMSTHLLNPLIYIVSNAEIRPSKALKEFDVMLYVCSICFIVRFSVFYRNNLYISGYNEGWFSKHKENIQFVTVKPEYKYEFQAIYMLVGVGALISVF